MKNILCYHICATDKNNPYLLSLHPRPISEKKGDIAHMKLARPDGDFRFCIREKATTFICVDTKEVFEITQRNGFTVKAWEEFVSKF